MYDGKLTRGGHVMVNFKCPLGWTKCLHIWLNIILNVSERVSLAETKA